MKKPWWLLALGLISSGISAVTLQPARAHCPQAVKIIVPQPPGGPGRPHRADSGTEAVPGWQSVLRREYARCHRDDRHRRRQSGAGWMHADHRESEPCHSASVGAKNPFSVPDDFTLVTLLLAAPETISVNPSVPAKTMQELIALAKANPGKYNYASPGYGSSPQCTVTCGLVAVPL
jgi:hypothetical protein